MCKPLAPLEELWDNNLEGELEALYDALILRDQRITMALAQRELRKP